MVKLLQAFKNTFLPSEEVSAARRRKVFGTTSKKVAGAVILGTAAGAIAAPALIASGGGVRAAATKAVQSIASAPLKTKVIGTVAAGAVIGNPVGALQLPARLLNFGENVGELTKARDKDEFVEKGKDLLAENPIIAGATGLGVAALAGKGILNFASGFANRNAIRENTEAIKESATQVVLPNNFATSETTSEKGIIPYKPTSTPLTPEVIDVSKPVSTTRSVRKRKKYKQVTPSIRVNVLNQQTFVS